ncbi:MAG TPA: hypothetical protein H9870_10805 [Candidatus Corynebacterium avicola]|uniref:Uncharacterized protein n=1 Tax=Candidatus Corynebacterium avicola TaxID=2838527 RepID=A0A9D1RPH5_9CORY|nr:hypothetical protein [Candidatus Corynebacterium avicola]
MARHSAADSPTRVAAWVWVALAALVVVAVVVAWTVFSGGGDDKDDAAAASCIDGDQELLVWVDPAATKTAEKLVDEYNSSSPVVRDKCVTATYEVRSTADAVRSYREGMPGVAPVWIPAGTGFISGLSGAPTSVPVVGTDELVHVVPEGADAAPGAAAVPVGPENMVSVLAAVSAVPDGAPEVDAVGASVDRSSQEQITLQQAQNEGLPFYSSAAFADGNPVGEVQFPLVAFGSSPSVEEDDARAATDFLSTSTSEQDEEEVTPEPASPRLARYAGLD